MGARRRAAMLGAIASAAIAFGCGTDVPPGGSGGSGGAVSEGPAACNLGMGQMCNPFGVALPAGSLDDTAYWRAVATTMHVPFYRPEPQGMEALAQDPATCTGCAEAASRGLRIALVVKNGAPPASLDAYASAVRAAIDRYGSAIAAVIVEEEPTTSWSATPAQYLEVLAAACKAAHARGARCAAGGVDTTATLLLVADYYETTGFESEALRVLAAASDNPEVGVVASDADVRAVLTSHAAKIDLARTILAGESAAGVDFANFHWQEADQTTLDEAITLMRRLSGCNAVMTDALGARVGDAMAAMHALSDAKELGLRMVIWASAQPGDAASIVDAAGAVQPNGASLAQASSTASCED